MDPTAVPTSYPSFACATDEVRLRWRFAGDWTGVSANFYAEDDAGNIGVYRSFPSFPRTAEYDCLDCNFGCFDSEFLFTAAARLTSHELSYVVELHRDDGSDVISTPFEGNEPSEQFRFCLEDCSIARQPTPAPTISLPPTFAPSPAPSLNPSAAPTPQPTPMPQTAAPTQKPIPEKFPFYFTVAGVEVMKTQITFLNSLCACVFVGGTLRHLYDSLWRPKMSLVEGGLRSNRRF